MTTRCSHIPFPGPSLAIVGKPEPAMLVEYQIIRAPKRLPLAVRIKDINTTGCKIDHFDPTTGVVFSLFAGPETAI